MATIRLKKLGRKLSENIGMTMEKAMISPEVGYSPSYAKSSLIKRTKGWQELLEEFLPDKELGQAHKQLLNSNSIGHMVFPIAITDKEITELLKTVNCIPKKIQHGDTANHVWFWSPDNNARKNALDMAYKLKRRYPKDTGININVDKGVFVLPSEIISKYKLNEPTETI